MHVHSSVGTAPNNMGNESYFRWTKGACSSKRNVSLNFFLGAFMAYNTDCSASEYAKVIDMLPVSSPE